MESGRALKALQQLAFMSGMGLKGAKRGWLYQTSSMSGFPSGQITFFTLAIAEACSWAQV